jgi:hypothetical protein
VPLKQFARAATDSFIVVTIDAGGCSPQEAVKAGALLQEHQEMLVL